MQTTETMRTPLMSGHCAFPSSEDSHARCHRQGAGNRANPAKEYQPCPCSCHFPIDEYECGACGRVILEAPHWPPYEDGDTRYTHIDKEGRAIGDDCP